MKQGFVLLLAALLAMPLALLAASGSNAYQQSNLTADTSGKAAHTDPQLVNPWGNAFFTGGDFWVSDNKTGLSTLYDGTGTKGALVVTILPASGSGTGSPTGIVANGTGKFGGASFIFDTLDGTIQGWFGGAATVIKATRQMAVYTGLTLVTSQGNPFLLAANFNSGAVDVYDQNYASTSLAGNFTDPTLPAGYAPFGIHNVGGTVYITYAEQNAAKNAPVIGKGLGIVSTFDQNGNFLKRFATAGALNAPWGATMAPSSGFGLFSGAVLIGNYGDGAINAYNSATLKLLGGMHNGLGLALKNPGTHEIVFGAGGSSGSPDTLYITVGVSGGTHGLLAGLSVVPVSLLPGTLKFSAPVGTTSLSKAAMLTNNQSTSINITNVATSDPHFVITSNGCGASLAAGASCVIKVAFAPTATGTLNGTLDVTDTGPGSPQHIKLVGTGT